MSGMWKRSHGRTSEAPPDERGGYRYVRPTATAPHLDSTQSRPSRSSVTGQICPIADPRLARHEDRPGWIESGLSLVRELAAALPKTDRRAPSITAWDQGKPFFLSPYAASRTIANNRSPTPGGTNPR